VCQQCGTSEDDPFVLARVGVWASGLCPAVYFADDFDGLCREFEVHHGCPPLPFEKEQWNAWLDRHEHLFKTLCVRCARERGESPSGHASAAQQKAISGGGDSKRQLEMAVLLARRFRDPSERRKGMKALAASVDAMPEVASAQQDAEEEEEDDGLNVDPRWDGKTWDPDLDVGVDMVSKGMMTWWLAHARKRVKAKRALAIEAARRQEAEAIVEGAGLPGQVPAQPAAAGRQERWPGGRPDFSDDDDDRDDDLEEG